MHTHVKLKKKKLLKQTDEQNFQHDHKLLFICGKPNKHSIRHHFSSQKQKSKN